MKAFFGRYGFTGILTLALGLAATTVDAQSSSSEPASAATATSAAATQPTDQPQAVGAPFWESIGGFDMDSHATGYSFFGPSYQRPLRENLTLTARVFGNYLFYEFNDGVGTRKVRQPGVSTGVGLRFGGRNWFQLAAGPSFKYRRERVVDDSGNTLVGMNSNLNVGLNLGADAYLNPTTRTNVHGMVVYGTDDKYIWSRVGAKRQLTNAAWTGKYSHFAGGEVILQGNDDIRSTSIGGLFEIAHVPNSISITLRGGYKRSGFQSGPDKTGPYFAVGFYRNLH